MSVSLTKQCPYCGRLLAIVHIVTDTQCTDMVCRNCNVHARVGGDGWYAHEEVPKVVQEAMEDPKPETWRDRPSLIW